PAHRRVAGDADRGARRERDQDRDPERDHDRREGEQAEWDQRTGEVAPVRRERARPSHGRPGQTLLPVTMTSAGPGGAGAVTSPAHAAGAAPSTVPPSSSVRIACAAWRSASDTVRISSTRPAIRSTAA